MSSFNMTNWEEHPRDNRYFVFRFSKMEQARRFAEMLTEKGIEYQAHEEEEMKRFAVSRADFDQARKLNYLVMAEHREPMIANAVLRWGLVLIVLAAVTIAIIGHFIKQGAETGPAEQVEQTNVGS